MASQAVHLLVLVHGMWGNPTHLRSLHKAIKDHYSEPESAKGPNGERLEVLLAETNQEEHTYDGIDWGGERVAEEILAAVKQLEDDGQRVTRFSITGYSLGGLVSRYVVGVLHQRGFFDNVTLVNFNTIATPHIGLPRYPNFISSLASYLGPMLLSRTGEQFWALDKWSPRGRPLLEVMADPERIFYQALCKFEHLRIYANVVNDRSVPYPSAAIEADDIFNEHLTNGIEIELDGRYAPIIKSYHLPDTPPPAPVKPKKFSAEWFGSLRLPLPPALQFKFPYNILIFISLPIILPVLLTLVLTRLSLSSLASRKRLRLLEKEDTTVDRLMHVIARLERGMEDSVAEMLDGPGGVPVALPGDASHHTPATGVPPKAALISRDASSSASALENGERPAKAERADSATATHPSGRPPTVLLTELQLQLIRTLNTLPRLKKELVYLHPCPNAHGPIICRDPKRFPSHKVGEGVVRHWVDHFII